MTEAAVRARSRRVGLAPEPAAAFEAAVRRLLDEGYRQVWDLGRVWVGRHRATADVLRVDRADFDPLAFRVPVPAENPWPGYEAAKRRMMELGFEVKRERIGSATLRDVFTGTIVRLELGDYGISAPERRPTGESAWREAGLFAMCAGVPALLLALATWAIEGAVAWPAVSVGLAFGSVYGVWKSRPRRGRA